MLILRMRALPNAMPPLNDLVACPQCDTLHLAGDLPDHARAHCQLCGLVIATTRPTAVAQVLSLALTAFILMIAAVSFPFLDLDVQGHHNSISVIEAVMAFDDGLAVLLAFAVAGFIVILPLVRLGAIIYAIEPLVRDAPVRSGAKAAFGIAEALRPWSMAEIFIVGASAALIKVSGIASVTFGPAFWAFAGLVVITVLKDQLICRFSIWQALEQQSR